MKDNERDIRERERDRYLSFFVFFHKYIGYNMCFQSSKATCFVHQKLLPKQLVLGAERVAPVPGPAPEPRQGPVPVP